MIRYTQTQPNEPEKFVANPKTMGVFWKLIESCGYIVHSSGGPKNGKNILSFWTTNPSGEPIVWVLPNYDLKGFSEQETEQLLNQIKQEITQ